jgi:hypothetical protein
MRQFVARIMGIQETVMLIAPEREEFFGQYSTGGRKESGWGVILVRVLACAAIPPRLKALMFGHQKWSQSPDLH